MAHQKLNLLRLVTQCPCPAIPIPDARRSTTPEKFRCKLASLFFATSLLSRIALGKVAVTANTGTVVLRTVPPPSLPPLNFFAPFLDEGAPVSFYDLSIGSSSSGRPELLGPVSVRPALVFTDPFGLSVALLQSQGTATAVVAATADAPFTLFGFSRAELYTFFDSGEEIAGNVAFATGVATLVTVNPVVAGVAFSAKVTQAAFAVGKVAFSENPLNELVEVGVSFVVGRAGGAAAGQAFRAARRAGFVDSAVNLASRKQVFILYCSIWWQSYEFERWNSCLSFVAERELTPALLPLPNNLPCFFVHRPGVGTVQR